MDMGVAEFHFRPTNGDKNRPAKYSLVILEAKILEESHAEDAVENQLIPCELGAARPGPNNWTGNTLRGVSCDVARSKNMMLLS